MCVCACVKVRVHVCERVPVTCMYFCSSQVKGMHLLDYIFIQTVRVTWHSIVSVPLKSYHITFPHLSFAYLTFFIELFGSSAQYSLKLFF